jgi:hypothetical protein
MKKKRRSHLHSHKKRNTSELAADLAPLEEQDRDAALKQIATESNQERGAIVVDTQNMQLPHGVEQAGEGKSSWGIEPVVIVIVGLLLVFIAFITWQITQMPNACPCS